MNYIQQFETAQMSELSTENEELCLKDKWIRIYKNLFDEKQCNFKSGHLNYDLDAEVMCNAMLEIKISLNDAIKYFGKSNKITSRNNIYNTPERKFAAEAIGILFE